MISVLIVDDEYLIRSLIRNSVRWEAYGMEVVGEAGDGESALSFIRTFQPQIALVDINMPILNGLELAQKAREGNYKTHIIFLTGYRDFEYAKQAVTYQAFDYLLKPIDADELAETLIRLSGQIAREQRLVDHVQKIEKQSDRGKRLLRERFLRRLVFGRMHMTQQQLTEQMRRLEISLEPRNLAVMVVELDLTDRNEDDGLYVYAVLNMLEELLEASGSFSHIEGISEIDNCAVVLCNADGEGRELCRLLREAWRELTGIVGEHFPFTLAAGVSRRYQGYDRLGTAMQEAMDALGEKFYHSDRSLFFQSEAPVQTGNLSIFKSFNFEELQLHIHSGEREEGLQIFREFFRQLREEQAPEAVSKMAAMGLAAVLYSLSAKYELPPEIMQSDGESVSRRIDKSCTCDEMERVLTDCYNRLMDWLQESRKVSKLVHMAKEHIQQNYTSSDLSLKKIAAAVFAAPAYVSSLFKKEMGLSVTEYITVCRMQRAAELLHSRPDSSLTAISEQVGYTDPYYFSRCFKRYYGVTPSKFLFSHAQQEPAGDERRERRDEGGTLQN